MKYISLALVQVAWIAFTAWIIHFTGSPWYAFLLIPIGFFGLPKERK